MVAKYRPSSELPKCSIAPIEAIASNVRSGRSRQSSRKTWTERSTPARAVARLAHSTCRRERVTPTAVTP